MTFPGTKSSVLGAVPVPLATPGPAVAIPLLPLEGGVSLQAKDSTSQKSAETSDAEDEDVPVSKAPASVLSQSA